MKTTIHIAIFGVICFIIGAVFGAYLVRNPIYLTDGVSCADGMNPDKNGCCNGEIYTDMGDKGFNCCPEIGGDCFPPLR